MASILMRSMNGLVPDITIEEQHQDQYVITDHPVEGDGTASGTVVSDHAYKLPSEVIVTYAWAPSGPLNSESSPTFLNDLYAQILAIGDTFTLFSVYTGKRVYDNMLIGSVTTTTDKETENILLIERRHLKSFDAGEKSAMTRASSKKQSAMKGLEIR